MSRTNDAPLFEPTVLETLLRAARPMTPPEIARVLGWRAERVRRQVDRLRELGCELEAHPQLGVRLIRAGLATWEDYLRWALGACAAGRPGGPGTRRLIEVYRQTGSTQDAARRLADRKSVV